MKFIKNGIIAGAVMLIVLTVFSFVFQTLFNYNAATLPGMRSVNDPLMTLFFLSPVILGIVMAFAFDAFKTKNWQEYAGIVWLIYCVPSTFVVFTSMTYPVGFTIDQIIGGLTSITAGAFVIEKFSK